MKRKWICLLLAAALLLSLAGCAAEGNGARQESKNVRVDLMKTITPVARKPGQIAPESRAAAADFALRLFRAADHADQNTLISPLSVLCVLAMTANGAEGATLVQMESTLGIRRDLYNDFFSSYLSLLRSDEKGSLKLANALWFNDRTGFVPKDEFLECVAACYAADAFRIPFTDAALKEMNDWGKEKTSGMIPAILDQISDDAVTYLINALAFDAAWADPYKDSHIHPGEFTTADGTTRIVDFMYSEEQAYLHNEKAAGFIKYYAGGKYAFVALLPAEGVTAADCFSSLDGSSLQELLSNPEAVTVKAAIPIFQASYAADLSGILKTMGMELPFDPDNADFSSLGTSQNGRISISRVLHKTYLSVDQQGTKAGASSAIEATDAGIPDEEYPEVVLDRPFIYLLIDTTNHLPLLIGTMLDPAQ